MSLKEILDNLYEKRSAAHLANDPLSFVHRFADTADREVAGLIASSFAYGNVKIILRNLERVFGVIGPSPRAFVEKFEPRQGQMLFSGFKHRFNDGRDLCALLFAIRIMIEQAGSIEGFFTARDTGKADDITPALASFSEAVLNLDYNPVFGGPVPADSYFPFLFPSPSSGSACKRLCMFLRWMVRPADGIDLGVWSRISSSRLVIPVDAHIQRIGRYLGLTGRRQADWKMAREITQSLRRMAPEDPVKYDFSLCHLGISEKCDGKDRLICLTCPIAGVCKGAVK